MVYSNRRYPWFQEIKHNFYWAVHRVVFWPPIPTVLKLSFPSVNTIAFRKFIGIIIRLGFFDFKGDKKMILSEFDFFKYFFTSTFQVRNALLAYKIRFPFK